MSRGSLLFSAALAGALTVSACAKNESEPAPSPAAQAPAAAGDTAQAKPLRKVARKATLSLEVKSVGSAHARAVAVAEERGGHVQSSSRVDDRGEGAHESSSLVLRVPGDQLTGILVELRRLAAGSINEQIASEDVTDEFVDTEARLRNHGRLEEQLLELLKTAGNVEAALKVHQELAGVRGEIERLEGRRQFLERETSWASINLTLSELPVARMSEGFVERSFGRAKRDALAVGEGIVVGAIRLGGVFLPVVLLLGLPTIGALWLLRRLWLRRQARRPTPPVSTSPGLG